MSQLKQTERVIVTSVCLQEGIVPLDELHKDVNRALMSLPLDEQKRMKRRFRKLWRKAAKKKLAAARLEGAKKSIKNRYGLEMGAPSKAMKVHRKELVYSTLHEEKIKPVLDSIDQSLEKEED